MHATRDPRHPFHHPPYLHHPHNRHRCQPLRNRRSGTGPRRHRRAGGGGARLGERRDLRGQGGRARHRRGRSDVTQRLLPPGKHPRGSADGRGPPARVRARFRPGRNPRGRYGGPQFCPRPRRRESREHGGARLAAHGRDQSRGARHRAERAQHRLRAFRRRNAFQGGFAYGGRFGQDGRLGFLLGGSAERNNRAIDDIEPAWGVFGGTAAPQEWSMRDYRYGRERYGIGGDVDYRFNANSQLYVKGLWSRFDNYGTNYIYDIAGTPTPGAAGNRTIPGGSLARTTNTRTPQDRMWAATVGGKHTVGVWTLDYSLDAAGTKQQSRGYRFSNFDYSGPPLTLAY